MRDEPKKCLHRRLRNLRPADKILTLAEEIEIMKSEHEHEIEYEYDCLHLELMLSIITFHTNLIPSLLFNWPAIGRGEGSGNVTGLKFESHSRTRSRIPI